MASYRQSVLVLNFERDPFLGVNPQGQDFLDPLFSSKRENRILSAVVSVLLFRRISLETRMKKRTLAVGIAVLLIASLTHAQVGTSGLSKAEALGKPVYGLGFSAGWASGVGISFRSHLPSKISAQGVFGIIKTSDKLYLSLGGECQYDLVRGNATRLFGAGALSYFYAGSGSNEVSGPLRLGAGVGGEFQVRDALHVSVEGLFVFFSDGRVIPLPQIAAHYYFF